MTRIATNADDCMVTERGQVASVRDAAAKRIHELTGQWGANSVGLGLEFKKVRDTFPARGDVGAADILSHTPRPGWHEWLEANTNWSHQQARAFIRVAEKFGERPLPSAGVSHRVLEFLAREHVPDAACEEVFARIERGEKVGRAKVEKIVHETLESRSEPKPSAPTIILKTHLGEEVPYRQPASKATFNRTNEQVSWAAWTWNPLTGCLHGCPYCYARELANKRSLADAYPIGFAPLFHHERLDAPANTKVPVEAKDDPRLKRVFVVSMGDLYGKWVPNDWIEQVHASCIANPQWDYLMLTKFARRYVGLDLPKTAWLGTTVDEQKRVRLAEEAFRQIKGVRVKWLSLEPLLAPLQFTDLSMFDWVVIGSQSATQQPEGYVPEFAPPFTWVAKLVAQAQEAGCRVYLKPNLLGIPNSQSAGMQLLQESLRKEIRL